MVGLPDPPSIGDRAKRGPSPLFRAHITNKCSGFRLFNVGRYARGLPCLIVVVLNCFTQVGFETRQSPGDDVPRYLAVRQRTQICHHEGDSAVEGP